RGLAGGVEESLEGGEDHFVNVKSFATNCTNLEKFVQFVAEEFIRLYYRIILRIRRLPMSSQSMNCKCATSLGLVFALLFLNACSPGSSDQETQPGWVTIDSTLSVDDLENLVGATAEPTALTTLNLSEAQAKLPFAFGLPTWTPE